MPSRDPHRPNILFALTDDQGYWAMANAGKEHNLRATALYPGGMDTGWRGAPIGVKPASETMDPDEVARYIGYLVSTPAEFVINEAVLNPIADPFM